MTDGPQLSASILNADFAQLGDEVERAVAGGVDSIHLDVMDGHFVDNLTMGPVVVGAVRPRTTLPFHSHLMISRPLAYAERFAEAGSDLIVFHVEAEDDPREVIGEIERAGKRAGIALNPETPADAVLPYLERVDLLLVMTVHPGWGGQAFIADVMPKMRALGDEIDRRGLTVPIGVDGGVNLETIGMAHAAGGSVLVAGSALYSTDGDLAPTVAALRAAARAAPRSTPPRGPDLLPSRRLLPLLTCPVLAALAACGADGPQLPFVPTPEPTPEPPREVAVTGRPAGPERMAINGAAVTHRRRRPSHRRERAWSRSWAHCAATTVEVALPGHDSATARIRARWGPVPSSCVRTW